MYVWQLKTFWEQRFLSDDDAEVLPFEASETARQSGVEKELRQNHTSVVPARSSSSSLSSLSDARPD